MERTKILFLYTELAGYFLACIKALEDNYAVELHIVKWPVNKEAPFHFNFNGNVTFYDRKKYSKEGLLKLAREISPHLIYCSGWMDKDYLKVCKEYKKKMPVIVGFDNQWKGSLKQWMAVLSSPFTIQHYFTHAWVPGKSQAVYALKLGFADNKIVHGLYAADFDLFYQYFLNNMEAKKKQFPQRFIYVGRYMQHKGIEDLWQAFIELQKEQPNDWELWCLGAGDIAPLEHPKIKHFGFVQPAGLSEIVKDAGVFVLPSHFEPWGVVVHEFAAAGFPLICSDEVGSGSTFLHERVNGYSYPSGNVGALKSNLRKIMNHCSEELYKMSEQSVEIARPNTPAKWAETIMKIGV